MAVTPDARATARVAPTGDGADSPLVRYDRAAFRVARSVIGVYSTSFGLATRLLPARERQHIRNVYALVRLADEIVDGVAAAAGLDRDEVRATIEAFEAETYRAMRTGYSANPVIHAFASTARECGIEQVIVSPFFTSMRMDLAVETHTADSVAVYIDGSAEVVGLMCLRVFTVGRHVSKVRGDELERGARALGAAFQKVNFLRDLAADADGLGRTYFPGVDVTRFDEVTKHRLLDDIESDLATAAIAIALLPHGARRAVGLAHALFAELAVRLRRTPAERLRTSRVRVPDPVKLQLAALALADRLPR